MLFLETKFNKFVNQSINEKLLAQVSKAEVLTPAFMDLQFDGYAKDNISYFMELNDMEGADKEKVMKTPGFKEFMYSTIEDYYNNALEKIKRNLEWTDDGRVFLFRKISVKDGKEWIKHLQTQGKRLGIYWTFAEDKAQIYWGKPDRRVDVLMCIMVKEEYINWVETLQQNTDPGFDFEDEIRLFPNTPIILDRIVIDFTQVDLHETELDGKVFKA